MAKLHLITYGCQMNEYDSERVAGLLRERQYELTDDAMAADVILLNTCAIREKAEEKVFSRLGELKRLKAGRPDLVIGVMGCMAQLQQETVLRRAPQVDLVPAAAIARGGLVEARRERRPVLDRQRRWWGQTRAAQGVRHGHGGAEALLRVVRAKPRARHAPAVIAAEIGAGGGVPRGPVGQTVNACGAISPPPTWPSCSRDQRRCGLQRIRSRRRTFFPPPAHPRHDVPKVCEWFHLPLQLAPTACWADEPRLYARPASSWSTRCAVEPAMAFHRHHRGVHGRDGGFEATRSDRARRLRQRPCSATPRRAPRRRRAGVTTSPKRTAGWRSPSELAPGRPA
jgi:hypothetical protein